MAQMAVKSFTEADIRQASQTSASRVWLSPPHMGAYEQAFVNEAFLTNWIAPTGPHVEAFEREMAAYVGAKSAVALSSGTAAIHLALKLLQVGPGDIVFNSALTFAASANPVVYQGATNVFIDSEPNSWNMSPDALKQAFTDAEKSGRMPKAVIIVDIYGQSADMDALLEICNWYGVSVIEDAAEALGAAYKGRCCGTFGKFGIFSFNGNKIITTSGGGMLVSDDLDALQKARFWAAQSLDPARHYQHSEIGYNYRMSNILAGIGRGQLRVLDERIAARRKIFEVYQAAFTGVEGISFMPEAAYGLPTRWLTVAMIDPDAAGVTPEAIMDALGTENIEARRVWKPLQLQPVFQNCKYYPHQPETSISEQFFNRGLCLPSGSSLTGEDQHRVIDTIKRCLNAVDHTRLAQSKQIPVYIS